MSKINKSEFKINWNEHAEYWDEYPNAKFYSKKAFSLIATRVSLKNLSVLDYGCGTGLLTEIISKKAKNVAAIDSSPKMIDILKNKKLNNVTSIVGELSPITIGQNSIFNNKFDIIVASSVCAFIPNFIETLSIIKSLLKLNGYFFQLDWHKNQTNPSLGFTESTIRKSYESIGLKIESVSKPFFIVENDKKMEVMYPSV